MVKYGAPILRDPRVSEAAELFPDILKVASGLALSLDTTMWEKILGGEIFQIWFFYLNGPYQDLCSYSVGG